MFISVPKLLFVQLNLMNKEAILRKSDIFTSDLYQFTCSYSYFISMKHEQSATFEVFFRKYPFDGKYAILGGIRSVKTLIDNLELTQGQENYLKELFPHFKNEYFTWLRNNLKGKIDIKCTSILIEAMKEGEIVFAKEPLITFSGPLGIVQLLETPILNLVGFATLVATNASRMVKAVEPKKCIEFGIRRAQGPDGASTASEFAYLGGFAGTSNLQVGHHLRIPCVGTMSHAYVTSFHSLEECEPFQLNGIDIIQAAKTIRESTQEFHHTNQGELAAFLMYAKAFPMGFSTLIDSYSTLKSGVLNTIIVAKALSQAGVTNFGTRIDSGDLRKESIAIRQKWNQYFPQGPRLTIYASDDLHEERMVQLSRQGNQIDIFAIGTNIATCKKQPALGLVCKLVELDGTPKMKLSSDASKVTYPAKKSVYRVWSDDQQSASFDLIALESQDIAAELELVDPQFPSQIIRKRYQKIMQLNQSWDQCAPFKTIQESKRYYEEIRPSFAKSLKLSDAQDHPVFLTKEYIQVFHKTKQSIC